MRFLSITLALVLFPTPEAIAHSPLIWGQGQWGVNTWSADTDNDLIPDDSDTYPDIPIGDLADTDGDGAPDDCDQACIDSGMAADTDDDNDGVLDTADAFPLDASESVDTDGDGIGNNADEDDDNDGYSDVYEIETGTDPLDPADFKPPYDDLNGIVYHWSKHSVMSDVVITRELSDIESTATSNEEGKYLFIDSDEASYQLSANGALTERDTNRTITSADALAALKIAVGLNPNSDPDGDGPLAPLPVSPYQLIAADMNQDGRVTSGDALAILKIAVGLSDALSPVWALVEDSQPIWSTNNDKSSVFDTETPYALSYPSQTQANFAAILVGDVNSSWSPESGVEILDDPYFSSHALAINAPLSLWGIRDTDSDGLSDAQEETLGTAIDDVDTDDDGVNDALDAFPLDPERTEDLPSGLSIPKIMGESPLKASEPVTLHSPVLLRGDMNDWGTELTFEKNEDGSYSLQTIIDAGTYTFKIATDNWAVMDLGAASESERLIELGKPVDLAENASTPFIIELRDKAKLVFEINVDKQLIVTGSIQSEKTL